MTSAVKIVSKEKVPNHLNDFQTTEKEKINTPRGGLHSVKILSKVLNDDYNENSLIIMYSRETTLS